MNWTKIHVVYSVSCAVQCLVALLILNPISSRFCIIFSAISFLCIANKEKKLPLSKTAHNKYYVKIHIFDGEKIFFFGLQYQYGQ